MCHADLAGQYLYLIELCLHSGLGFFGLLSGVLGRLECMEEILDNCDSNYYYYYDYYYSNTDQINEVEEKEIRGVA